MKLATYRDGSRDGQLVVVSRDLSSAHYASGIATRMQQLLDDWNFLSPQLEDVYVRLNQGKARHAFAFDPAMCLAPLPRPAARLVAHASTACLQRRAAQAGLDLPAGWDGQPLLRAAAGERLLGARDGLHLPAGLGGADAEAGLACLTGDLPADANPQRALESVRLLMTSLDWVLREAESAAASLAPLAAFGLCGTPLHARPAVAFSPVAVTPDELGEAWRGGRVHLSLDYQLRGDAGRRTLGRLDCAGRFHLGQLLAEAARGRPLAAGTLLGCGPASQVDADTARGCASLAGLRALEAQACGEPASAWLQVGQALQLDLKGADGHSVCGAIEQILLGDTA